MAGMAVVGHQLVWMGDSPSRLLVRLHFAPENPEDGEM